MSRQATTLAVTSSRLWSLSIQVGYSGDASSLRSLESTGCPRAPDFIVFYDARPSIESFECTATYQCSATRCQCSRGVGFRPFLTTSRTHPGDTGRAPTDLGPIHARRAMPSSVVYAAIAVAVLVIALLVSRASSSSSKPAAAQPVRALRSYSMEEISKHNAESDVWIVLKYGVEARVYDITEYCDMHPGGDVIYDSAGKDATEKFNGPQHPPTVHDLIREYHIGWVEGSSPASIPSDGGGTEAVGEKEKKEH